MRCPGRPRGPPARGARSPRRRNGRGVAALVGVVLAVSRVGGSSVISQATAPPVSRRSAPPTPRRVPHPPPVEMAEARVRGGCTQASTRQRRLLPRRQTHRCTSSCSIEAVTGRPTCARFAHGHVEPSFDDRDPAHTSCWASGTSCSPGRHHHLSSPHRWRAQEVPTLRGPDRGLPLVGRHGRTGIHRRSHHDERSARALPSLGHGAEGRSRGVAFDGAPAPHRRSQTRRPAAPRVGCRAST